MIAATRSDGGEEGSKERRKGGRKEGMAYHINNYLSLQ